MRPSPGTVNMAELWTIRDCLLAERHSYSTREEAIAAKEDSNDCEG